MIRPQIYFWITSKRRKNFYLNKMQNISATHISCDHTFKNSRNIGVVSEGGKTKFVMLFKKVLSFLTKTVKLWTGG